VPRSTDNQFLYHALKGRQNAIMGLRVGSGLPNVQKTALAAFKLNVPSENAEQTAIAGVLSDMDAEIATLERRRDKTRDLKQGMMQELLTGKTRLVSREAVHA
jgi:type I restriction enzyme S subunit